MKTGENLVRDIKKVAQDKTTRLFISFKRPEDNSILHVAVKEESLQDSILRAILFASDESVEVCENNIPRNAFEESAEKIVKDYADGNFIGIQDFYRYVLPSFREKTEGTRFIWIICKHISFLLFEDDSKSRREWFYPLCAEYKDELFVFGKVSRSSSSLYMRRENHSDESTRSYWFAQKFIRDNDWHLI